MKNGFSVIEVLITIAIIGILAGLGFSHLTTLNLRQALALDAEKVLSVLAMARAETLAGRDGFAYGVHLEDKKAVLFRSTNYYAGDATNRVFVLHDAVHLPSMALAGGGAEVRFNKVTGATEQKGTLTLSLVSDSSVTKIITIFATGVAQSD